MSDTLRRIDFFMNYYCIFGNHPALSVAEWTALCKRFEINVQCGGLRGEVLQFGAEDNDEKTLLECARLCGGLVKLGKMLTRVKVSGADAARASVFSSIRPLLHDGKFRFGLNLYPENQSGRSRIGGSKGMLHFAIGLKRDVEQTGVPCRWVSSKDGNLSSVIVTKERLIETGADVCLFFDGDEMAIGRT